MKIFVVVAERLINHNNSSVVSDHVVVAACQHQPTEEEQLLFLESHVRGELSNGVTEEIVQRSLRKYGDLDVHEVILRE